MVASSRWSTTVFTIVNKICHQSIRFIFLVSGRGFSGVGWVSRPDDRILKIDLGIVKGKGCSFMKEGMLCPRWIEVGGVMPNLWVCLQRLVSSSRSTCFSPICSPQAVKHIPPCIKTLQDMNVGLRPPAFSCLFVGKVPLPARPVTTDPTSSLWCSSFCLVHGLLSPPLSASRGWI